MRMKKIGFMILIDYMFLKENIRNIEIMVSKAHFLGLGSLQYRR